MSSMNKKRAKKRNQGKLGKPTSFGETFRAAFGGGDQKLKRIQERLKKRSK